MPWTIRNESQISQKLENSDCNWIRTHNHLVHKRTLNHISYVLISYVNLISYVKAKHNRFHQNCPNKHADGAFCLNAR